MTVTNRWLFLFVPLLIAGAATAILLSGMGGSVRVARAEPAAPVCFAKADGGAVFESATFTAPQAAVDALGASGGVVLVAGTCTGVQERASTTQTVYISAPVTLRGGYTTDFTALDPNANPTVLDAALGGRVIYATDAVTVENLAIRHGSINGSGGGVHAGSTLAMTGTAVLSNNAGGTGGGVYVNEDAIVVSSRIEKNQSGSEGGGLWIGNNLTMTGTQVLSNTAKLRSGGVHVEYVATVANSRIENNRSTDSFGGGLWVGEALAMTGTQVVSNTAKLEGGGVQVAGDMMSVLNSRIDSNHSGTDGGGLYSDGDAVGITNTLILSNTALGNGGGVFVGDNSSATEATVANSLLVSNTAHAGGGIFALDADSSLHVMNSTLAANLAVSAGGGISSTGPVTITNSVLWLNTPSQVETTGASSVIRSIIQGGELGGNADDPQFVRNPDRAAGDLGNLRLSQASPAIDAGEDGLVPPSLTTDLDGNPRLFDVIGVANNGANVVDMGAYEAIAPTADAGGAYSGVEGTPVDLDGSGSTGVAPLASYAWDCTDDGTVDAASGTPTGDACTYPDNGDFTVRLLITDTNGLTGTATTTATISNVSPVVTAAPAQNAEAGTAKSFSLGSFSDAGVDDGPWQVDVDWGDGEPTTTFAHNTQGILPDQAYTYTESGQYSVTVTVTDKDSGAGSAAFSVNVAQSTETLYLPAVRSESVK